MTYIKQLINNSSPLVLQRKKEYIHHNFGKLIDKKLLQKNCSVLEIGPGLGEFVSYCKDYKGASVDIIDTDTEILQFIKKNYQVRNAWISHDIQLIEKKLAEYDLIMMTQVLEHIQKEKHIRYLQLLYRKLKKNGVIIITVPNIGNPLAIFERYYDYTHKTAFTEHSLIQMADYAELKDVTVTV